MAIKTLQSGVTTPSTTSTPASTSPDLQQGRGNAFMNGVLSGSGTCEYTVVPGDTLWGISETHTGHGSGWRELYDRNQSVVGADPNLIFPGQQLDLCDGPRLGLDAYEVVPDDFVGPLAPNQIRQSQRDELDAFDFGDFEVVANDFTGPLSNEQMRQSDYDELQRAWLNIDEGIGMNITGSAADQQAFKQMMRDTLTDSPVFRGLLSGIGNDTDPAHLIQADVGRGQPNTLWDSFATNAIDLDDMEAMSTTPSAAHPNEVTRGTLLTHFLAERQDAAVNGNAFAAAHGVGMTMQNLHRAERGQDPITSQTGSRRADGGIDGSFNISDGTTHQVTFDAAGQITGQVRP